MTGILALNLAALAALVPLVLLPFRRKTSDVGLLWASLILASLGAVVTVIAQIGQSWNTGLALTLWVSVAASLVLFAVFVALDRSAWRLTPLLAPYLAILGLLATVWRQTLGHPVAAEAPGAWVQFHIVVSVATYGLLTLSAVSGLAAFLQERALKTKTANRLTEILPSVADSEHLSNRLLAASEVVLGLGLASGMAVQFFETGVLLQFDHKTLLSILAFLMIGALLIAKQLTGVRGRAAARLVLVAYLLLTLAYPGVKFVTDVLLS
ncbi:MAG: hypothetical protein A2516_02395 [Alphaproteobacteria bacterium RIFOXYD12_FULL_60_8]|nr:MAG: hypothetical protein A2516_02395 [Alphaproteobacteria bacterium RIFOXYD12_FULL_60_8]